MYGFFYREHCGTNPSTNLHSHMSHCSMCSLVELQLTYTRNFQSFHTNQILTCKRSDYTLG